MLLRPPANERGFKREGLLRVLLNHPDGDLGKRELGRRAGTTGAWSVKFTKQLEVKGLVEGTKVINPVELYEYWQEVRVPPSTVTVSMQSPVEMIQGSGLDHTFTTYQAENARQGFLFPSNSAVYVRPNDVDAWTTFIEENALVGGGNTEFRIADDHVFYNTETVNELRSVSIPQLILDLLDEGGPCVDAAERLIEASHE